MHNDGNQAFIDGQNLHMSLQTHHSPWKLDSFRFRKYLDEKYHVHHAYYFLGFLDKRLHDLYARLQSAGFILVFKQHESMMLGKKKGNVDTDIVFTIMKKLYENDIEGKVILVSGDGDFKALVDFLIIQNKLAKIIFPNQSRASSLYKSIALTYGADLSAEGVRKKIEIKKRAP